jgi:hypothetical protein
MMNERIDFTALELDAGSRELLVAAVLQRAGPELERRVEADVSPIVALYDWARPALAAAAVLAMICLGVLAGHTTQVAAAPGPGLTEALAVPTPVNEWLIGDRSPTRADLLLALEGD